MTLSVHVDYDSYAGSDDWTEVGRTEWPEQHGQDAFTRVEYASNERTCLKSMRGWKVRRTQRDDVTGRVYESAYTHHGFCLLDKDHRGRHSTVVFYCDGCGKTLRGEPHVVHHDQDVQFCYSCASPNGGWW